MKNENPCTVCGVPEADHSQDWRSHSYVPPVGDDQREPLSADGLAEVLSGQGTVSEIAAKENATPAPGTGSTAVLDRLDRMVNQFGLMVHHFGKLIGYAENQPDQPEPEPVANIPTTVVHTPPSGDTGQVLTEDAPSNPEPLP